LVIEINLYYDARSKKYQKISKAIYTGLPRQQLTVSVIFVTVFTEE